MTPAEFRLELQAFEDRQRLEWERAAWIVAYIHNMSPYSKKKIKNYKTLLNGQATRSRLKGEPWA